MPSRKSGTLEFPSIHRISTRATDTELIRGDLCEEAIWLAEFLSKLVPTDPEVAGLHALLLLTDARRASRLDRHGSPILPADQDRSQWDQPMIARGLAELARAHSFQRGGKLAASTIQRRLSTVCGFYRFAHMSLDVVTDSCSTVTMPDIEEVEAMVERHLAVESTMFLSTSADDQPWVAGVFFTERGLFELSVILEVGGRTLSNIRQNPSVAVVVSHGDPFAPFLQGAATAEVLDDDGARPVVAALRSKSPQIEPLLGAPFVAVTLRVAKWRATDVVNGWLPGAEITA